MIYFNLIKFILEGVLIFKDFALWMFALTLQEMYVSNMCTIIRLKQLKEGFLLSKWLRKVFNFLS